MEAATEESLGPGATGDAWLRTVIDSAGALIVCTDASGCITEFNPAAERVFGRRRQDVLGVRYSDLLPAVVRDKVDRDCARVLGGQPIDQFENTISDGAGHQSVLLWDMRCLRDAGGRAAGIVAIAQDITARLGAEASIEWRRRALDTLASLHRAILGLFDPEAIAATALTHLHELVPCSTAAVYAFAPGDVEPRVLAAIGNPPAAVPTTHGAGMDEGEVVLPLVADGEQVGLLYVEFEAGHELNGPQRVAMAAQIAEHLAAALHVAQAG